MKNNNSIQLFDDQPIRTAWDAEKEEGYFSIVDVVGVLTEQPDINGARNYWKVLKNRLSKEGSQLVTNCNQLKMLSQDGKRRLTDEITRAWSGLSTRQYKQLKGLKKENLRDNMTTTELVLNMLAETSTTDISKVQQPQSFSDNVDVARMGGEVAGIARKALEDRTGKPVITPRNAAQLNAIVTGLIESISDDTED